MAPTVEWAMRDAGRAARDPLGFDETSLVMNPDAKNPSLTVIDTNASEPANDLDHDLDLDHDVEGEGEVDGEVDIPPPPASGLRLAAGLNSPRLRRPRVPFCWVCSLKFRGRDHRVCLVHDNPVCVHVECAENERLEVKPGAHLLGPDEPDSPPRGDPRPHKGSNVTPVPVPLH